MSKNKVTVIDVETSGIEPDQSRVIEIAALHFVDSELVAALDTLILPSEGFVVPEEITYITGIKTEMLKDAPSFADVAGIVASFIEGNTLLGHYIPFDLLHIQSEMLQCGRDMPEPAKVLDTWAMSNCLDLKWEDGTSLRNHRLTDLVRFFDLDIMLNHRAMADVLSTLSVYRKLKPLYDKKMEEANGRA